MNAKRQLLLVCLLLASITVQAAGALLPQGQKQIPEGKWILESVSAFEENVQTPFSVDKLGFEIPTEMVIQQDEITFDGKESTKVDENFLCFQVCARWEIVDNTLQLQWKQDIEDAANSVDTRTIVLSYVRK